MDAVRSVDGVDPALVVAHATVPALFSVGLMDPLCPPSTVCAAFNHWAHPDESVSVWESRWRGHPAAGRGAGPGRHLWR